MPRILVPGGLAGEGVGGYGRPVLKIGDPAPDFVVDETTLHRLLADKAAVVYFFPKAFTPG
jgi:hypothetical protein